MESVARDRQKGTQYSRREVYTAKWVELRAKGTKGDGDRKGEGECDSPVDFLYFNACFDGTSSFEHLDAFQDGRGRLRAVVLDETLPRCITVLYTASIQLFTRISFSTQDTRGAEELGYTVVYDGNKTGQRKEAGGLHSAL